MKTLLICIGLVAVSAAAVAAEWTSIGGNDDIAFYADLASRKASGETVQMWSMVGSKKPRSVGEKSFSSIKTHFEFDCAGKRIRELESSFHAGPQAEGEAVGANTEASPWEPVAEGTVKEALSAVACGKP